MKLVPNINNFGSKLSYYLAGIILFITSQLLYATQHYPKIWSSNNLTGPLSKNKKVKYYMEGHFRFITHDYRFNQFLFLPGLGYQVSQNVILFGGVGWIYSEDPAGLIEHENRVWQQISWHIKPNDRITIDSRTRLEERKFSNNASLATRFRERLWLRIPLKNLDFLFFSSYDEVFFIPTHPKERSDIFLNQNRAFIGMGIKLTNEMLLETGYLNQYVHTRLENECNNVWLINVNITLG